ncbi:hypothetical protein D0Z00_003072 [Geotrichum galactomycetum]|uniref:Uncharacterized protein n=1 Tax=Geotrichum galactomycetum TaxID=27317 RepID=A0ACB6V2A9_9ASCO|nr:hypothetical protein D0Z00_003072 [Geotrichum candidum]
MSQSKVPIPYDGNANESKKDAFEVHKFMYVTQTLFPPPEIRTASAAREFTLPAGRHAYDFSLVIPDNLACQSVKQPGSLSLSRFVIDKRGLDYARSASSHTSGPLPPSLSDIDKHAIIRYFLKVTVARTSFLKPNIRVYKPIVFLPPDANILPSQNVLFVRRNVLLGIDRSGGAQRPAYREKKSSIKSFFNNVIAPQPVGNDVSITLEMRYPDNSKFTPLRKGLPFKLYAISKMHPKESSLTNSTIQLSQLTINLFSTTDTRAQSYIKSNTFSLPLYSDSVNYTLDWSQAMQKTNPQFGNLWELEIPSSLYQNVIIPDFVPPTFTMCNIKRYYQLEVSAFFTTFGTSRNVSLIADIVIMSGLSRKNMPSLPNRPAGAKLPVRPGALATSPGGADGDLPPPSYEAVLSEEGISAAQPGGGLEPRRQFGQAPGYYENLESLDEKR